MSIKNFNEHILAMVRLESQEHLRSIKVQEFTTMNEKARSEYHAEIRKKAFPVQKVYSFDDIESIFGG